MSCTEREAKKRWCPFARTVVLGPEGDSIEAHNRLCTNRNTIPITTVAPFNCLGSTCMAWRWTDKLTEGPDAYRSEPGPTGYCGLAGKPT